MQKSCHSIKTKAKCASIQLHSFNFWGTLSPRTPARAPPLDPLGGFRLQTPCQNPPPLYTELYATAANIDAMCFDVNGP